MSNIIHLDLVLSTILMMQLTLINDIETKLRQKLPIGKRQNIISAINQFRETIKNAESTMLQTVTRRLQVPQNDLIDINGLERKLSEFLKRPLTSDEIIFIRQCTAVMNNSILQAQTNIINRLTSLTGLNQNDIEGLLIKHHLIRNISIG